jgi:hypothetical protein
MSISTGRSDTVAATATTYTTHVVHVELAALLGAYDPTDTVVVMIQTPSGRDKRVTIGGNFLVAPHHTEPWDLPDRF